MNLVEEIAKAIAFQKEPTAIGWAFFAAAMKRIEKDQK